jgi:hypothetical protein
MASLDSLANQAVLDALAIAGPGEDGAGFIRTSPTYSYLDATRLRLAREALAIIGDRRKTTEDVAVLAALVRPRLRELVLDGTLRLTS